MSIQAILYHPDGTSLYLDHQSGFIIIPGGFDRGSPVIREQVYDVPFQDGTTDTTSLVGGRTLTIALRLVPKLSGMTLEAMRRQLLKYMSPNIRPTIQFTIDDQVTMQASLRSSNFSTVLSRAGYTDFVAQWVVPNGVYESAVLKSDSRSATSGSVSFSVTNVGDMPAWPIISFYGSLGAPGLLNFINGAYFKFSSSTTVPGSGVFYQIDMRKKTAISSATGLSVAHQVDPSLSTWWYLAQSTNPLQFSSTTQGAGSSVTIQWRDAYL